MTTLEAPVRAGESGGMAGLVRETVLLAAEVTGLASALHLRSELRALTLADRGRVVLVGEDGACVGLLLAGLLEAPELPATLSGLPRVRTTYHCADAARLTFCGPAGERELPLTEDGATYGSCGVEVIEPVLQIDVGLPAPLLLDFAVTHLPDLHDPRNVEDPLDAITPDSTVVFVSTASRPLSVAEMRFLAEARARTNRIAVVVAGMDEEAAGREVLAVDQRLLERIGCGKGSAAVLPDRPGVEVAYELEDWLVGLSTEGVEAEARSLVAGAIEAVLAAGPVDSASEQRARDEARSAERELALASREATSWLPRLGYEFTRLRSEMAESMSRSLTELEHRYEAWIQAEVSDAVERLPAVLVADLRRMQRRANEELGARLQSLAHQFLYGRERGELTMAAPGSIRDFRGGLVRVAQAHSDARNELFASLGNFGSGRQSIGMVSSVVSAVAMPVTLAGGVIGLGFWQMGRRSRQEALARTQATRWLKVQLAEAGRGMRFDLDQSLNDAQLVLNLAVREHHDALVGQARLAVERARGDHAAALAQCDEAQARRNDQLERARGLRHRSRELS